LLVEEGQTRALAILKENIDKLHKVANYLLENEVIDGDSLEGIINPV
jgi:ATP-dependent Zn protease